MPVIHAAPLWRFMQWTGDNLSEFVAFVPAENSYYSIPSVDTNGDPILWFDDGWYSQLVGSIPLNHYYCPIQGIVCTPEHFNANYLVKEES